MNGTADPGRALRPYELARGQTELPGGWGAVHYVKAVVTSTGGWEPEYAELLRLTAEPIGVVEVCAHSSQPSIVAALLLADLIDIGAVETRGPVELDDSPGMLDLLGRVLVGLRAL